jgi:hypothetical protein
VVVKKTADSKESLKIIIKASTLGGQAQAKIAVETAKQPEALKSVIPVHATGLTGSTGGAQHHWSDRFPIPVRPAFESLGGRELSSRRVQREGGGRQMREALSARNSEPSQLLIFY